MNPQASPQSGPPGGMDEQQLAARARAGDPEAFASIYNEHRAVVHTYLRRRATAALADDLTSQTFLRALCHIGTFTWRGTSIDAWLITIARNLLADHFKSARVRREITTGDPVVCTDRSAEDVALRRLGAVEAAETVHAALARLTPLQRDVVRARYLRGLTLAETREAVGAPSVGAVKTAAHRAMSRLRTGAVA